MSATRFWTTEAGRAAAGSVRTGSDEGPTSFSPAASSGMLFGVPMQFLPAGPPPAQPWIPRRPRRGLRAARDRVGGGARRRRAAPTTSACSRPRRSWPPRSRPGGWCWRSGVAGDRGRPGVRADRRERDRSRPGSTSAGIALATGDRGRGRADPAAAGRADRRAVQARHRSPSRRCCARSARRSARSSVAGRYISATAAADIGGDLYEALDTPYGVRMIIGDVRGKGLDAVRLASIVLGSLPARGLRAGRPARDRRRPGPGGGAQRRRRGLRDRGAGRGARRHADDRQLRPPGAAAAAPGRGDPAGAAGAGAAAGLHAGRPARGSSGWSPATGCCSSPTGSARRAATGEFFPTADRAWRLLGHGTVGDGLASLETALVEWVRGRLDDDIALVLMEYTGQRPVTTATVPSWEVGAADG